MNETMAALKKSKIKTPGHFPYSCFHSKIDARINNDNIVEGENIGS
jgi:hypothetical protein